MKYKHLIEIQTRMNESIVVDPVTTSVKDCISGSRFRRAPNALDLFEVHFESEQTFL